MPDVRVTLSLEAGTDELPIGTPALQAELKAAGRTLKEKSGCSVSELAMVRKAVGGGSEHLGQYVMAVGPAAVAAVAAVAGAWLHARFGRKVRIKIGEVEAEASTVEEVELLLAQAKAFQVSQNKDGK